MKNEMVVVGTFVVVVVVLAVVKGSVWAFVGVMLAGLSVEGLLVGRVG